MILTWRQSVALLARVVLHVALGGRLRVGWSRDSVFPCFGFVP